jgi:hypothetical protein
MVKNEGLSTGEEFEEEEKTRRWEDKGGGAGLLSLSSTVGSKQGARQELTAGISAA